jgi:group I intron endonuclease
VSAYYNEFDPKAHCSGIYSIENSANGKKYIGSSKNMARRWIRHVKDLKSGIHHSVKLQRSFNKHGFSGFKFKIIIKCSVGNLIFYEQKAIDAFNSAKHGYNSSPTAGSCLGCKHTEETRKKVSVGLIGNSNGAGSLRSEGHKLAVSMAQKGNTHSLGYKHTEQSIKKISDASKNWERTESVKEKIRAGHIGKVLSDEHKLKLSIAKIGKKMPERSDEHKAKISAGLIAAHAKRKAAKNG